MAEEYIRDSDLHRSKFPYGCADVVKESGRKGSNVYDSRSTNGCGALGGASLVQGICQCLRLRCARARARVCMCLPRSWRVCVCVLCACMCGCKCFFLCMRAPACVHACTCTWMCVCRCVCARACENTIWVGRHICDAAAPARAFRACCRLPRHTQAALACSARMHAPQLAPSGSQSFCQYLPVSQVADGVICILKLVERGAQAHTQTSTGAHTGTPRHTY